MWGDFKAFLLTQNALALAIGVVIGAAAGKVVTAIVDDLIMPIVGAVSPGGDWQKVTLNAGPVKFGIGDFASAAVNFLIVAFVVWQISKVFIRPAPPKPDDSVKACPFCRMSIDAGATRCPHCTSQLAALNP
ncbi:MAG TPA: large conductance mechanosensitive channel protein MscL [Gemmatimonadaceae bacterium]